MTVAPSRSASSRRAATVLVVAVLAVLAVLVGPSPAGAETGCDEGTGVRVVVDQGPLGGGVSERCVADGADRPIAQVMTAAGVDITWVQRYPGAFVCRLDSRPQDLPCANTPPGDSFWGLFWAAPGDPGWTYATEGAASLSVPDGGAVGWRFQDGGAREDPASDPRSSMSAEAASAAGDSDRRITADDSDGSGAEAGGFGADDAALLAIAGLAIAGLGTYAVVTARRRRS